MNALRHGLSAIQPDNNLLWEQMASPSFGEVQERSRRIEMVRFKLLRNIERLLSLAEGSTQELQLALKRLEASNRYIKRAYAKLKGRSPDDVL